MNGILAATAGILGLELLLPRLFPDPPLLVMVGILRIVECGWILALLPMGLLSREGLGMSGDHVRAGLRTGILGILLFAGLAFGLLVIAKMQGLLMAELLPVRLPEDPISRMTFFLVGGLLAPLAEELYFRGVLFGGFRKRMHWVVALLLTTLVFVLLHKGGGLVQAAGGIAFCIAFQKSDSLLAPILIHTAGNLALFSLPLLAGFGI